MTPAEAQAHMPVVAQMLNALLAKNPEKAEAAQHATSIANFLNVICSGYCAMHEAMRAPDNPGEPEAWIGDPETIFVWGTHDPSLAAKLAAPLWEDEFRPPEEDIARVVARSIAKDNLLWIHPSLTQESEWHPALVSNEIVFGWVPLLVIDL